MIGSEAIDAGGADVLPGAVPQVLSVAANEVESIPAPPTVHLGESSLHTEPPSPWPQALSKVEELERKYNRLQLETMHGMADQVDYGMGENRTSVRFLYLTNEQAVSIPEESMDKVCTALKLGSKFAMVIRIMPCQMGKVWWKAYPYSEDRFPEKRTPEPDEETADTVEHQLLLLAKEILLPQAIACKALVLGQEGCSLTASFLKVSSRYVHERGERCPFKILIMCRAHVFHLETKNQKSVVHQFWRRSENWKGKTQAFERAMLKRFGGDPAYWPQLDLPPGKYSMIVFECLDSNGRIHEKALHGFQHDFISSLTDDVPVLALSTFGMYRMSFVPTMSEHINRGMPLILIDSRVRPEQMPTSIPDIDAEFKATQNSLHAVGVADWYSTSAMAYVKGFCDRLRSAKEAPQLSSTGDQRRMWIHEAITECRMHDRREREAVKAAKANELNSTAAALTRMKGMALGEEPSLSYIDDEHLVKATDLLMKYVGGEMEWEMNMRHERFEKAYAAIVATQSFLEFQAEVDNQWMNLRGCCFHLVSNMERFAAEHLWCELKDEGEICTSRWSRGRYRLAINPSKVPAPSDVGFLSFNEAKGAFLRFIRRDFEAGREVDATRLTARTFVSEDSKWMAVYDILSSKYVSVSSLHDLRDCRRKFNQFSTMNNLPENNTLEALVLLRTAWNLVEEYTAESRLYGRWAKIAYFFLLLFQMAIIIFVTLRSSSDTFLATIIQVAIWMPYTENIILGLSISCALITAFTSMVSPTRKWTRLKGAALQMESEIWKFRTRQGDYRIEEAFLIGHLAAEREAEKRFASNIGRIIDVVKSSAGMKRTSFFARSTTTPDTVINIEEEKMNAKLDNVRTAKFPSIGTTLSHGQVHLGQKPLPSGEDNHHSPECPDHYVIYRLVPARDEIQKQIPQLARLYSVLQVFLLCSTIVNTGVAAVSDGTLTAILAAGSGFITAWQEFISVEFKLDSFSNIARTLDDLIMWWQALPEEHKRVTKNIEHLVATTEAQIAMTVPNAPGAGGEEMQGRKATHEKSV